MLASLWSCATRAFSLDSTFCAHSLVARPHLSIRVCVSVCHSLLLVYLFHLRICESFSTLLTLANILHQIFCATILTELHYKPYLCRCEKPTRIGTNCAISLLHIEWSLIHLQHRSRYIWYHSSLSPTNICSSLVMDRQGISPSVYNNNDKFDATNNSNDAKMQAQMEEIKALIKSYKRSSSSSRRRSRAHASELPSPARSHRHRHH